MTCICDARFSGNDDMEYRARGCPSCTCKQVEVDWDKWNKMHQTLTERIFMQVWKLIKGSALLAFAYAVLRTAEFSPPVMVVCFLGLGYFFGHMTTEDK